MVEGARWAADWAVIPGEVLVEALEERGMSQAELARRLARPLKTVSEIATGKAAITPETAIQLERALGISAHIWLRLESRYREAIARERDRAMLHRERAWLDGFPLGHLTRRRIIDRRASVSEQTARLLAFFGVSSPTGWAAHWGEMASSYRLRTSREVSPGAIAVWLREAELAADGTPLPPYDPARLRMSLDDLKRLSKASVFAGAVARARELLRAAGVGFVVTEGVPDAPASGALRWSRATPWIVLTLRFKTDDQFWFSLFHEIGHLLTGRRGGEIYEEIDWADSVNESERLADRFAREALVPAARLAEWLDSHDPTAAGITAFASELDVAPGIVVGRLQREKIVDWSKLNFLKRPVA